MITIHENIYCHPQIGLSMQIMKLPQQQHIRVQDSESQTDVGSNDKYEPNLFIELGIFKWAKHDLHFIG